jgi:hypothetical protein
VSVCMRLFPTRFSRVRMWLCNAVGTFVAVRLAGVPAEAAARLAAAVAAAAAGGGPPVTAFGLMPHEAKMSVVHFAIKKVRRFDSGSAKLKVHSCDSLSRASCDVHAGAPRQQCESCRPVRVVHLATARLPTSPLPQAPGYAAPLANKEPGLLLHTGLRQGFPYGSKALPSPRR